MNSLIGAIPLVVLVSLCASPAHAEAPDAAPRSAPEAEEERRGRVFPPRILRRNGGAEAPAVEAAGPAEGTPDEVEAAPTPTEDEGTEPEAAERVASPAATRDATFGPDTPAAEPEHEGIWAWVARMEGEIPTPDQVQAIDEQVEAELAERALIDRLAGAEVPTDYYSDPRAVLAVHPLFLDQVDPSEFDIPVVVNPEVEKWVRYFTGSGRKYYERWLSRSTRYRPMMYRELEKAGLPRDLVYLSMIESGYNAHAYSHASAAGLWQFIPSTAKLYKMRVDWWVDERRDPARSLQAAIDFLGELHRMFGKWELAWAGYNTGPGRVRRAIRRAGSDDFWVLARGPYLHSETDNYVPKIMAAAIIGKHPERYGFTDVKYQEELVYETTRVQGSVSLEVIADAAGVSVDSLKRLNPALRRFATPPEGYDVRLPVGQGARVAAALKNLPAEKKMNVARHTVRSGETVSAIATRYGVTVNDLSRANGLANINRIYVGMSLVVPVAGQSSAQQVAAVRTAERRSDGPSRPASHTVQRGDTLSGIAARYNVRLADLRAWNGLSGDTIRVGQQLNLRGGGTASAPATPTTTRYTVKRGDTLSTIAARHQVKTADLQRWNKISNPSSIQVGQVLTIQGAASSGPSWTTYTVRSGDSLGKIAAQLGCSVQQLQEWNQLRGTVIHPGQQLRVRG